MARPIRLLLMVLAFASLSAVSTQAATINAATCGFTDVSNAVNAAADGDTVVIPACPGGVSWTTRLGITKGITLQGQGIGVTVLIDDVPKSVSGCGSPVAPIISFTVNSPQTFRLSGLTIRGSAVDTLICNKGHVILSGTVKAFRVDHIRFENQQTAGINIFGDMWGVIDHCQFQGIHKQGVLVNHELWGGIGKFGDNSWATPTNLGTQEFVFIEDCTFDDTQAVGAGATDFVNGGRVVFRHNTLSFMGGHGTESTGRARSMRAFEIYENTFTAVEKAQFAGIFIRGGTGVIYNNTFIGTYSLGGIIKAANFRDRDRYLPWATCDGTSAYDKTDGVVYAAGFHDGPDGVSNVLTDSSQDFSTACNGGSCAGFEFSIRNVTKGWGASIQSVTTTTVTNVKSNEGQGRLWNIGDVYQIRKAYPCVDQVGRGQGDLLSGSTPTPAAWPNQALEPVYQWGNTLNGVGSASMASTTVHVVAGRDFLNNVVKPGYTPFQYPHPLTLSGTLAAPTNLRKVAP